MHLSKAFDDDDNNNNRHLIVINRDVYRVVGFEVEPKSIDSKRIKVQDDGRCTIESGIEKQKINPQGKPIEIMED